MFMLLNKEAKKTWTEEEHKIKQQLKGPLEGWWTEQQICQRALSKQWCEKVLEKRSEMEA